VKTERLALMHSAIAEVYSESAAEKAKKLCGGMCSPVVVPCGAPRSETQDDCIKNRLRTLKEGRKLCVSFFGEFDNSSDGALSFIFAVNRLGRNFKTAHKIKYCLYGSGSLNPAVSLELFDKISHAPKDAFAKSDIVVLPRSSDNLGYTALNAMAAASLVLTPRSLASDMFCESGYNCLEIPHDVPGIARAVLDAAVNFRSYAPIADNARRTAKFWNIGRIVRFNVYAYRRIAEGRHDRLVSAYGEDERGIIQKFYRSHDTEKLYNQDLERLAALKTLEVLYEDNKSVLLLTGASGIEKDALPENAMAYSVLNETTQGITLRPECLPFEDDSYDTVILTGAWEAAANPCSALMELQRIAKENIVIVYNKGLPRSWQHIRMDEKDDWTKINASAFYCSEEDGMPNLASPVDCLECDEPVRRNAEIKNKIREVIEALNGRTTLDAVVYTSRRVFMNAQTA
ncbi:MAG: hypothetical protein ACTTKL_11035, partial [Treponema sp.]